MWKIIPILLGIAGAYAVALILHFCGITYPDGSAIFNFAEVAKASWVNVPPFEFCKFDLTAVLAMAPIAIASMMEHIGDISAISATVGEIM